ncbi:high affinity cGMP-specific 3',5'-cyclic phosphodiesterase 9A-like isoform X2 [Scophthalmus maximus]|uniref:high affinity cGMP-specific 3',5'-cyclic phosphodiesterase 9A-like isoform X2 n=1 Tax=Scophthalmus maximus TaxID=52904 RepID=UPI0015E0A8B2|nr:high affinity cGMP-specific 3',5'-cyclic phosphodiesterase 9A-like isoform X2 [Scophthalmus maximus]
MSGAGRVPPGSRMTTKIIHFMVNGRLEQAEFRADCSAADVKGLFRAAAEAGPHHILKMYNTAGVVVNISPRLEANSKESYYRLEVVASDLQSVAKPRELDHMEHRLRRLESRVLQDAGETPDIMRELKSHVEAFKRKLESVEHLSWIGLFKDDGDQQLAEVAPEVKTPQLSVQKERQQVRGKFLNMSSLQVTEEVREHLKTPIFDNWQWEEAEMLVLLQVMYTDLDFLTAFQIQPDVLQNFLFEVFCHYNNIPFHNFQHCFCVTQMMYGLIWLTDLRNKLARIDLFVMLTSALCHDLDHPGYNNVYQINAQTALALRYNDISPLENHHCAVAFGIMAKPECNVLKNLTTEQYKHIRGGMIKCILATDMARHNEILNKFKDIQPVFDFADKEHKEVVTTENSSSSSRNTRPHVVHSLVFEHNVLTGVCVCAPGFSADEDHGEGERHLQRGEADGGGRAVAGLSAAGVLQPERHRETQRTSCESVHGPRQSVQTVVSDQLHPLRPAAAVQRTHQALPRSGGEPPVNHLHLSY